MKKHLYILAFLILGAILSGINVVNPAFGASILRLYQGGTGIDTIVPGDLLIGSSSTYRYDRLPIGSSGQVLRVKDSYPYWESGISSTTPFITVCNTTACTYTTDGTADDVQIQAAINAGNIFIKDGSYAISAKLTIPSNRVFKCESWNSILTASAKTIVENSDTVGGNTNILIEGCAFNGSNTSTSTTASTGNVNIDNATNVRVVNIKSINSPKEGVELRQCTDCSVINSYVENTPTGAAGIMGSTNSENITIANNFVKNAGGEAFGCYYLNRCSITGNISRTTAANVDRRGHILFEGNSITPITNVIASNNVIESDYSGIGLISAQGVVLSNNKLKSVSATTTTAGYRYGIDTNGVSSDVSITGNVIDSFGYDGILIQDTAKRFNVSGNVIKNISLSASTTYSGITVQANGGTISDINITGNEIIDNHTTPAMKNCVFLKAASGPIYRVQTKTNNCYGYSNKVYDEEEVGGNTINNSYSAINTYDYFNDKVSIGTTTAPTSMINIETDSSDTGIVNGVVINNKGTGDSVLSFGFPGVSRWIMGMDNSDSDKFKIGGNTGMFGIGDNTRLTIDASGRVGIGTTTPSESLHIIGNTKTSGTLSVGSLTGFIKGTAGLLSATSSVSLLTDVSQILPVTNGGTGASSYVATQWTTNGSAIGYTAGNVGIGSTTATANLHINVNNSTAGLVNGIVIDQKGSGDAILTWGIPGTSRWVMGIDNSDSDKFKISGRTGMTDISINPRFVIDSGLIGIGTSSPDYELQVSATATSTIAVGESDITGCITQYVRGTQYWWNPLATEIDDFATTTKPSFCD